MQKNTYLCTIAYKLIRGWRAVLYTRKTFLQEEQTPTPLLYICVNLKR